MILIPIALALVAASDPTEAQVRKAVEASVVYLQEDGVDWTRVRKCASCHHAPMGVWALEEARKRGYKVDEAALGELVKYTVDDPVGAKLLAKPPKEGEKPGPFEISASYAALASRAVASPGAAAKGSLAKLDAYLTESQGWDGSWAFTPGKPPLLESAEVATLLTALALGNEGAAARIRALAWLEAKPPASLQARALRLLLSVRMGTGPKPAEVDALLKLQRDDGGWSQTPAMASDAYATGLVLYVLSESGVKPGRPEIARARGFLVRTQQDDGDWPMTSRPAKEGDRPAKDLSPITYASTAWATLGLLHSSPR